MREQLVAPIDVRVLDHFSDFTLLYTLKLPRSIHKKAQRGIVYRRTLFPLELSLTATLGQSLHSVTVQIRVRSWLSPPNLSTRLDYAQDGVFSTA